MKRFEFDLAIGKLFKVFNFPMPDSEVLDAYYDQLSSCSYDGINDAVNRMIREQKRMTRGMNICSYLLEGYRAWKSDSAGAGAVSGGCDDCDEPGMLVYWKFMEGGLWERFFCPCGYCRSYEQGAMTKEMLENKGFRHSENEDWTMIDREIRGENRERREAFKSAENGNVQGPSVPLPRGMHKASAGPAMREVGKAARNRNQDHRFQQRAG